ncbi:DUF1178 family protein [Sphingomonas prati]|uniref:DUF1178 domain-containing protein n=1 Tax=Sphingomonas prati TaxID=1843237 RepID=A0A7W9F1X7_9SPHN|nr:DUF1178 family protein [Sphingomonas prati]MBB5728224.1 hypothetical protein [Sphingomonas prati]GGE75441.1 hypothetical protein GCM10011404_05050 [Sphingomonas prati]
MIVYDLACRAGGHVFEGWFGSAADYDDQRARGLLSCPICGSEAVDKAPMAPRLSGTDTTPTFRPEVAKAMLADLARAQAAVLKQSDDVGDRFASVARAIHDGDSPDRVIHGRATPTEVKSLAEDGIPVMPLPLPIRRPGTDN